MKIVNRTKLMDEAYTRYKRSEMRSLYDAYDRFSEAKNDAWNYCKNLCTEKNGSGLKVIGANQFKFSAGFTYSEDNKNYFMFITDCNDRAMEI